MKIFPSVIFLVYNFTFLFLLSSLTPSCSSLRIRDSTQIQTEQLPQIPQTTSNPKYLQNEDEEPVQNDETTTVITSLEDDITSDTSLLDEPVTRNTRIDCQCGKHETIGINLNVAKKERFLDPFIIPAEEAEVREFPWIVAITKRKWDGKNHVVCGGSLINSRYVITAAHCIKNQPISRMELAFNVHNSSAMKEDSEVEIRKIRRFIIHSGWNQETVDNDIGLIELSTPIDFTSSRARPVCLPSLNDSSSHTTFDGLNATVAGWGYTKPQGPNSQVLNKIVVPVLSHKDCQEKTIYKDKILNSMICAGYLEGRRDACTNDSGGPLMVQDGDKTVLIGLVSWGHGCARQLAPGVYTRVSRYTDWINKQITKGDWCQS